MILELRIVKELRAHFSEVQILKGLRWKWRLAVGRNRRWRAREAFELMVEITRRRVTYWLLFVKDHFGTRASGLERKG